MAPWSSRKREGNDADAVAERGVKLGSSTNAKDASNDCQAKPPPATTATIARATSSSAGKGKHHHDPVVKLSRPPMPFLFALFLNQLYINLIVLVPRQVGIYIIRTRFLPQNDPAAQLTGKREEEMERPGGGGGFFSFF